MKNQGKKVSIKVQGGFSRDTEVVGTKIDLDQFREEEIMNAKQLQQVSCEGIQITVQGKRIGMSWSLEGLFFADYKKKMNIENIETM